MEKKRRQKRKPCKAGITLVRNFLIPHLEEQTFGDKLFWVKKEKGIFKILWRHQGCSRFDKQVDAEVFCAWAKMKRLWNKNELKANTKAKQRFRAALLKIKNIVFIGNEDEHKIYKIITEDASRPESERSEIVDMDLVSPEDYLDLLNNQHDINIYISNLKNWLQSDLG